MQDNPFTPTFGEVPVYLAGRSQTVNALTRAFESASRRPELTTIFSGSRGTGKTTLLFVLGRTAQEHGWIAVNVTAFEGMLDDIEIQAREKAAHLIASKGGTGIKSIGIPQVLEVELTRTPEPSNWRSRMATLIKELNALGTGLLITVDEVDANLAEMVQLAAVYQHFVSEGLRVALLMAGLPHNISALLNDRTASFLRRANSERLERIPDFEVRIALEKTIKAGERSADAQGLSQAVDAIGGFAFLLQLVGYYAWDASPEAATISQQDFELGIQTARQALESRIFEKTYRELSAEDIRFLEAMLEDEGDSKIADICARLERSSAQVGLYRSRLIDAGIIGERRRGVIGFDLPYFREFLASKREG